MQVAVTGATGFVGRSIVPALVRSGHGVRLLRRNTGTQRPSNPTPDGPVDPQPTDFENPYSLASALRGCDTLIHLVGIISECRSQTFQRVHTHLTARMLAAARAAGVPRFVHMSALGTRPDARSRYHRSKWAAEELVRASGLDWTIFRPSIIYGREDAFTRMFARMAALSPALPLIGGGRNRMQPIAVEQVARAFAAAVDDPASHRQTYDLCGSERLTLRQILESILAATNRRRLLMPVPFAVARIQAGIAERLWPLLLRRAPPLNRDQLLMIEEDNIGDGTAADRAFGLEHVPFLDALRVQFATPR